MALPQEADRAVEAEKAQDAPDAHVAPHGVPGKQVLTVDEQIAQGDPLAPEEAKVPVWQLADVEALLSYIDGVGAEGLAPADYDPEGLRAAMRSGDPATISAAATERFNLLSSDLALGHARGEDRVDWHIVDKDLSKDRQAALLEWALYHGRLKETLDELLPTHPQYAALKTALVKADKKDKKAVGKIRLNLDRWRWLPRDLGDRYIISNIPAYTAALIENGQTISRHRAVAGAKKTPTPQLMAKAQGVIFNPWWEVPPSIAPEVAGKPGYVAVRRDDGSIQRWRQPPGPRNSLGRVKFVMYNPHLIYLHDTNARNLFNAEARARSHGCIRTENILKLATTLLGMDGGEWDTQKTVDTLNSGETVQANFVNPVPVYIVYFSVAATTDGKLIQYDDIYDRDAPVIAALRDAGPVKGASQSAEAGKDGVPTA
nr:L,D-transpeptidase family protein [Sphingomicrobium lutaoense]